MTPHRNGFRALIWTALVATATLAACGGGGGGDSTIPPPTTTVTLSGIVADGPISGATACYDLDDDGVCNATAEPTSAPTGADGRFTLTVQAADAGRHGILVAIPASAIDADTGLAFGVAFMLKAPPVGAPGAGNATLFVSPLTTLVVDQAAAAASTVADAIAAVQAQLGLAASPLADFIAAGDTPAARAARVVNQVAIEVAKLANAAAVPAEQANALVASATLGNLPSLGALASGGTGTPAQIAAAAAAATLAERNLSASTVVAQARIASQAAAPLVAGVPGGPFVSVRDFTYASASSYSYRLFAGDDRQVDAQGAFAAHEIRQTLVNGVAQPFNRNQVYWTGSTWSVCSREWQVVATYAQTASAPQRSVYCGASKSDTRVVSESIDGRAMADVVAQIRAFPLPDNTGLPTDWGPDPALLGTAVFPTGSVLTTRSQTSDVGATDRFALLDKPRVAPSFRHAASFADLKRMSANWVDPALIVTNSNTIFLEDLAATQSDPALRPVKRYRAGFNPANDAVRYFACDARVADNFSVNCVALGDGASTIAAQGDASVLRFASGYPAVLVSALKRQRLFVERNGVVFGGYRDLPREYHQQRLNTPAWIALRDQLGIPAHAQATAPIANPLLEFLRAFTYNDANNYSYRAFSGTGIADATGTYTGDEQRGTVIGGVLQAFAFNSEFWTGTDWYACPNDGIGVLHYKLMPRESSYCRSFNNTSTAPVVVTLDGRNMADVLRDIRWYPSKDGVFDYAGWGANPDTTPALAAGTFPPGSTMYYQHNTQTREPEQVFLSANDLVRNAPSPMSGAPYDSWPVATTLEEAIAFNPGNYGGGPLNGNVTLGVYRYFLPAPPDPAFTNEIGYRVAFDAAGQRARFFRHNRAVGTNFSTNYVAILDTAYAIETIGGYRVLKFAQTPDEVLDRSGWARIFVQRAGEVRYGQQTRIFPGGQHSIRLNGVAAQALGLQLGIPP